MELAIFITHIELCGVGQKCMRLYNFLYYCKYQLTPFATGINSNRKCIILNLSSRNKSKLIALVTQQSTIFVIFIDRPQSYFSRKRRHHMVYYCKRQTQNKRGFTTLKRPLLAHKLRNIYIFYFSFISRDVSRKDS